ncbi:hypothetical protein FE257_000456 [Aspergillus nanangensis]|uniref:PWI domain-containing protein n=1 Tax=Aspergillus nanangensis TaxID=2582783 RepID=A0AAD4CUU6_ASPNN|nr:hypothetical protein FE257_000456 [Aspergillus nanangensis]
MQVAEILSDLTSLRVCDHHDALALVTVNERITHPSESGEGQKPAKQHTEENTNNELQRAKELVDLHYEIKARHADGAVDEDLTKFPPEFSQKVDMTKVNIEVMKKWIAGKISEILGNEDDVIIELCFNLLEGSRFPDVKSLQIQLTGFLDKDTAKFCKELWSLCLSAQSNPQGVPKELLEAKKLELIQEKIDAEKAAEEARRQKEQERAGEEEEEEEVVEVAEAETSTTDVGHHHGDATAGSVSASLPPAENSTHTYPPVYAEVVDPLGPPQAAVRAPDQLHRLGRRRPVGNAPPEDATNGRGDAVLITVIELDPIPAVIPHAHVVPEETDGDKDLFLPAVHPGRLHPAIDVTEGETGRDRALALDRGSQIAPDGEDLLLPELIRKSLPLMFQRAAATATTPVTTAAEVARAAPPPALIVGNIHTITVAIKGEIDVVLCRDITPLHGDGRSSPPPEKPSSTDHEMKDTEENIFADNPTRPRISSTELREKLLREKLVAMRRTTSSDKVGSSHSPSSK